MQASLSSQSICSSQNLRVQANILFFKKIEDVGQNEKIVSRALRYLSSLRFHKGVLVSQLS